jgi:hypothetical protein
VTGLAVSSNAAPGPDVEVERRLTAHPWLTAARVDASARAGETLVRVVPSTAGVAALRRHGKPRLVDEIRALSCSLPADPRAWRLVPDLDDPADDDDYRFSRPRIRSVAIGPGDSLQAAVWVPYDLRVFEGHFEGMPLLPGMTQVAWALSLASSRLPGTGRLLGIVSAKFRSLVRPGTDLDLAIEWSAANDELRFEYRRAGATTALGKLRMTGAR